MTSLLIDVVVLPVSLGGIIPFAEKGRKEIRNNPLVKAGNKMGAADDIIGVEEPKCAFLMAGDKLDPIQPLCFPPGPMCVVNLEPANPDYIHADRCSHGRVQDLDLIDSQDPRIHVRVGRIIARESDHIRATLHVDLVSPSPQVVRRVVYRHREPLREAVADYLDVVAFTICEYGGLLVILTMQNACEEVVLQIRNEILANE